MSGTKNSSPTVGEIPCILGRLRVKTLTPEICARRSYSACKSMQLYSCNAGTTQWQSLTHQFRQLQISQGENLMQPNV